ncbi:activator-dependent family glycosyltransferase [Saccharomonospora glauca]|jgi:glycosyltransferase (activator-dependent family)|uniref:Glycosyl transferase, UDP-glucuronosyltransferase n=1 Tax=Saccharomonospora glauca K62 TaxID=928724 RepID=I1D200_9PSEU|nr:activator-dependent family glycosyltransferase [Saccharomonospora glauca]EIE98974.1 glycosyl transferase, UDP-glucuronosyltransferase [Saccharomonospora glauca K62]
MRVLFATYSEKTHFHAMVPLAWAMASAGHEVRVASQPALTEVITGTGLTAVPVGRDHNLWKVSSRFLTPRFAKANPEAFNRIRGVELPPFHKADEPLESVDFEYLRSGYSDVLKTWYRIINEPMLDDLVDFARQWRPDLVIWEPTTHCGPIAAEAVGAAHGRVLWSLDFFARTRQNFLKLLAEQPEGNRHDPFGDWLAACADKHGVVFSESLVVGQFTIDQYAPPLRLDTDVRHIPMRYVPYNGTSVAPDWLREPVPTTRVCLTLGQFSTEKFGGYPISVQEILNSLADLDIEVVTTLPAAEQRKLTHVPDNARLVEFVPLQLLIPTCAAAVHHGGFGTTNTIALEAVPQLVIAEQHDTPILGRRLEACRAGLSEYYTDATGEAVRRHLSRLLDDPSFGVAARALRDDMLTMPPPRELVPHLEKLAMSR